MRIVCSMKPPVRTLAQGLCALSFCATLFAQAQPAVTGGSYVLREGSEVKLKFDQDLSSKTAAEGDPVNMVLAEDIKVGDAVVARAGDKALATVSHVKKAGMLGKGGELNIRLEHLTVGDIKVKLRGAKGKEGQSETGTTVALTVLFGPIGLIKHGKNIDITQGTPFTAYVDNDISLPPAAAGTATPAATPQPIQAPAPAPSGGQQ